MKIVFILQEDVRDKQTWSGVPYYLIKAMKNQFETVHVISPVPVKPFHKTADRLTKLLDSSQKPFTGKSRLSFEHSNFLLRHYGEYIDHELSKIQYDIALSTTVFPFYFTRFKKPLIQITDGTPKLLFEHYYENRMSDGLLRRMEEISMKVVNKCSMIIASSRWCADSIINDYKVSESKVRIVPFGANVEDGDIIPVGGKIDRSKNINFLFIGGDWERKGGELTVRICDRLISGGYKIKLTVVGCPVPEQFRRDYINNTLSLNKNKDEDRIKLNKLFEEAHFFILPSGADMSPIVLCDAAACGVPVITRNVGGISEIVKDNLTGIVLEEESEEEDYYSRITQLIDDPESYGNMSSESKRRYEDLLNWNVFTKNLRNICERISAGKD
ncbi:MAG: glycosyltransferase family 4 protein [Ignavibacteria bacterium]|nr:glycosyltransferase family 4 protein [Ignavibacteria bacterium]